MNRPLRLLVTGALTAILPGCDLLSSPGDCQAIGMPSLVIRVRDQDGEPALRGSTVRVLNRGDEWVSTNQPSPLDLYVHWGNRAGRFLVRVEKPWYRPFEDGLIQVPGNDCGVLRNGFQEVDATIVLLPDAPPVRSIEIVWPLRPPIFPFPVSPCSRTYPLETTLDAAPGISQAVTWTVRDPGLAAVTEGPILTGVCGAGGSTYVVAAASADPSVRDSIEVWVAPGP